MLLLTVLPVGVVAAIPKLPGMMVFAGGTKEAATQEATPAPSEYQGVMEEMAEIPYEEVRQPDPTLAKGQEKVLSEGMAGRKKRFIRVTYDKGREVNREVTAEEVVQPPLNRVVAVGTRTAVQVSRGALADDWQGSRKVAGSGGSALEERKSRVMEATAYTHTGNRTASGIWPKVGVVAVDPRVIPLGTKLYIEGYGPAVAADTGGLIKGNIIDVFFDSYDECIRWGRKMVKVHIVE